MVEGQVVGEIFSTAMPFGSTEKFGEGFTGRVSGRDVCMNETTSERVIIIINILNVIIIIVRILVGGIQVGEEFFGIISTNSTVTKLMIMLLLLQPFFLPDWPRSRADEKPMHVEFP